MSLVTGWSLIIRSRSSRLNLVVFGLLASFGGGGGGGGVDLELFDDRDRDTPDRMPRCGDRDFRSGFFDTFSGEDEDTFLFAGDLDLLELDRDLDLE